MMPKKEKPPFCALPFVQVNLGPKGGVLPCCRLPHYPLGNVRNGDLMDFWNSEKMQLLRREFLSGNVVTCARAIQHSGCNAWNRHLEPFIERSEIQEQPPKKLDVRLNGQCNLECVMCEVWKQPNGIYDETGFWKTGPAEIFPHLIEIEVLGGEPFVQKDTFRLIDEISSVNPRCRWLFVTNGHWKFNARIRQSLDKILIKRIAVSIDSLVPGTYAKIRAKGDLNVVLQTLDALGAYREERAADHREFDLHVCMAVQRGNWTELAAFARFAERRGLKPSFIFVGSPYELSLASMKLDERREILEAIASERWSPVGEEAVRPILEALTETLNPERRLAHLHAQYHLSMQAEADRDE